MGTLLAMLAFGACLIVFMFGWTVGQNNKPSNKG